MAGSNFSQAMNAVGGAAGVLGSWAGAYLGVPKAESNKRFLKKADMVGRTRYGASDMAGLMSQWENTPTLQNISREDLYNPSGEEMFSSMFGNGMTSYSAMSGLTAPLKGSMGSTPLGNQRKAYDKMITQQANERVEAGDLGLPEGVTKEQMMQEAGYGSDSELAADMFESMYGCGGHMYGCGGRKFAGGGGLSFDTGSAVSTGLNLLSGGIGVALSYAGMMAQRRKAEQDAKEVNAANLYAQQLQQHNFNNAVTDTKNNMFNQQALQMMALGGHLFEDGGLPINVLSTGYSQLGGGVQTVRQGTVGNNSIYQFNLQSPEGFTASESTLVTPDFINMDLGNENARTIVRSQNPAEYAYQQQRIAGLQGKNLNPGNILPEVTVVARRHAMGGDLQTHGADFPLFGDFNIIGAGGTHEQNPYGGVFQGMAQDGQANLVEEDEVIWNDYVFSNRIKIPASIADDYKLKEGITYAEAAKKLSKEAEERPNDPISQNGLASTMGALMQSQEEVKTKREAARVKRQIAQMSPEEIMNMVASLQGGQPQQFANGGYLGAHTFDEGGSKGDGKGKGRTSRRAKSEAQRAEARDRGLYESAISHMTPEMIEYLARNIEGYNTSDYTSTDAPAKRKQFLLDNYDKLKFEGLQAQVAEAQRLPLLQNRPDYTYTDSYSMTPEQWNTFFGGMDAYQESLKAANTEGKYHADPNFTYNGRRVGKGLPADQDVEKDPKYIAFKKYVREQAQKYQRGEQADENVLRYMQALDRNINTSKGARRLLQYNEDGTVKTDDNGRMLFNEGWEGDYDTRNYDQVGGIYHYYNDVPDITRSGERTIVRLRGRDGNFQDVEMTPDEIASNPYIRKSAQNGADEVTTDADGNQVTTHYLDYELPELEAEYTPEEEPQKNPPLQTWPRYMPVLGSALGALAASAPAKDYSTGFAPRNAHYAPIGDYLPYMPVDTQRYINAENQQAAAQLNAIMNASAGNRNMAMAQAALANQQRQQGIGQRMQAAEQINWDRLRTAGEFNRGTNMFNAQAHNAAEITNLQNNPLLLRQEQQNAMMRHAVDSERDAAISASLNALFDNLGDIGRENLAWNQANSNEALRYFSDPNWLAAGQSGYKKPTIGATETVTVGAPSASSALGGYLLTKSKKNRR